MTNRLIGKEDVVCTYTHTHRNIIQPLKRMKSATCNNGNGPQEYSAVKKEKDKYLLSIPYMWSLKNKNGIYSKTITD